MAKDIFGYKRNPKPKGVFSSEDSLLTFGGQARNSVTGGTNVNGDGSNSLGYMVQNWQAQYQQQVTEMFEIGTNALYWAKGRPVGNGVMGRIIGQADADSDTKGFMPKEAYDLCLGGALVEITARSGGCEQSNMKSMTISMDGCVVTAIGFAMRVPDVMINENLGWRFARMEIK